MDQVFIEFESRVRRMNDLTLSICIATCNRAAFTAARLERIIFQSTEEVEFDW